MTDWEAMRAERDRAWKEFKDRDQAAKDKGELVGRYIQEQIADGYAYYTVTKVNKRTVRLQHEPDLGDGYAVPMIESMGGTVPLKYVRQNIGWRDKMADIFASKRK